MATQIQGLPSLQVPPGVPRMPTAPYNPGQRMPSQFPPMGMQGGMPHSSYQRHQYASGSFYRPFKPMAVGVEVDYEGKKLRKSMMRKTVDYNSAVICHLNSRVWQRDYRDRRVLEPDVTYYPQMAPPSGYLDNAVNAVTTRYTKVATNKMRCPIFCLSWTPEGRRLITGASSGEFTLWNGLTYNFETILQAHDASVRTMVWSHDDSWMATGDHNGFVKYWQSNMNNVKMFQAHKEPLRGLAFSPSDHKFTTCSDDGTVRIWDFIRCHEERILRGHGADVKCVDWHPHKGIIVSGSKDNQQPVKLWDPRTGASLTTLHAHKSTVMDIRWNQNGNWLLTASRDHLVKVFDIRNLGTELQIFRGHKKEAACLSWNPVHEALFASGGSDGAILFWHVGIDKEVGAIENAHDNMIWSLSWHPMGHVLASGANDHTTKFWTRNRPGDKMKDKYNLNVLPSSVAPEDAEFEDKSTYLVACPVNQDAKEEKANVFSTSPADAVIPGLDVVGSSSEISRSKITSAGLVLRNGPVEYIEFEEDKIPKHPVPMSLGTTCALKLLEKGLKVMYNFREEQLETGSLAETFVKLGIPQLLEKSNDESEPIDVKLLPFVTHIIAGGQVLKSEGKSEVFGAARASVERFYESLSKRGFFYDHRPFAGERSALQPLTDGELALYDGESPLPERRVRSPTPVAPPVEREPFRRKPERRREFDEVFEEKRGKFENQEEFPDESFWGNEEDFYDGEEENGQRVRKPLQPWQNSGPVVGPGPDMFPGNRGPRPIMLPGPGPRMGGPPVGPPIRGLLPPPNEFGPGPGMKGFGPRQPFPQAHFPEEEGFFEPPNKARPRIDRGRVPDGEPFPRDDAFENFPPRNQFPDGRGPPGPPSGPRPPRGRGGFMGPPPHPQEDSGHWNVPPSNGPPRPDMPIRNGPEQFRGGPPGRAMDHVRGGFGGRGRDDRNAPVHPHFDEEFQEEEFVEYEQDRFGPRDLGGRGGRPDRGGFHRGPSGRGLDDRGGFGRGRGDRRSFDEDSDMRGPPGRGFGRERGGFMGRGQDRRPEIDEEEMYNEPPGGRGFAPERGGFRGRGRGDGRNSVDRDEFRGPPSGRGFGPDSLPFRGHEPGRGRGRDEPFRGRGREERGRGHEEVRGRGRDEIRGRGRDDHIRGPRRGSQDFGFEEEAQFHDDRNSSGPRGRDRPAPRGRDFEDRGESGGRFNRERNPNFDEEFPGDRNRRPREDRDSGPRGGRSERSRGREPPRGR